MREEKTMAEKTAKGMNVKITDEELRGRYSNLVRITHTRERVADAAYDVVEGSGQWTDSTNTSSAR